MSKFLYLESSPQLKGKARDFGSSYRRMAVVEVADDCARPSMISERARGVIRIVADVTASVGSTPRSYGYRQRQELQALAAKLSAS